MGRQRSGRERTTLGVHLTESEARMLPRMQVGYPPQHLLLTLLGDYGMDRADEPVPSASLVSMLGDFGVTSAGARAAIARLARRRLLRSSRQGRNTSYTVTRRCAELVGDARLLTYSFTGTIAAWDGRWTLVAYSIGEEQRSQRTLLRARLRWLGFAPLQDGLWISPHPPSSELDEALKEVMSGSCSVFTADAVDGPGRTDPLSAWNVGEVRRAFDAFIDEFDPVIERLAKGSIGLAEALEVRTRLTYRWFNIANEHAELPVELLPPDWPAVPARCLFTGLIDGLAPLAAERIALHVAEHAPDLAGQVGALTVQDVTGASAGA
jgi:phenylacetic acid degradation operon negative regulatory protein